MKATEYQYWVEVSEAIEKYFRKGNACPVSNAIALKWLDMNSNIIQLSNNDTNHYERFIAGQWYEKAIWRLYSKEDFDAVITAIEEYSKFMKDVNQIDEKDENGAMFIRKDGKFKFITAETPKLKFSHTSKGNTYYLLLSGSAGGPSTYLEVFAFENGKQTERFNALSIYGEIDECHLNGKTLSKEAGQAYIDKLPESREINAYFQNIEQKNE